MRVLVLGASGQVGGALTRCLGSTAEIFAPAASELDLADVPAVRQMVRHLAPELIINAAAYTMVDQAEDEPDKAMAINGIAPAVLAEEACRLGAVMVHYSTDYVFDGDADGIPYTEDSTPNPRSVYGRTKLYGDQAIMGSGAAYCIFRTAWVYGQTGRNFLLTMQRLLRERKHVKVVADQVGTPTSSQTIARATTAVLESGWDDLAVYFRPRSGVYNMTCEGQTSWFGFAEEIRRRMRGVESSLASLEPIASDQYPVKAPRPAYSVLDNAKLARVFGVRLPDWREALDEVLRAQVR